MPGQTAYMDTPVLPTMAFADGYNLPDCEYPDTTPAIKKVVGDGGLGPWTAGADGTRAVTALSPSSAATSATYSRVPIIGFTGGGAGSSSAGADANMHVSSLTLTNRGVGFTGRPTVTFAGGAPTTNATATATMRVGSIAVDESGSGYTSRPGVTLSGGSGSGASVTANNVTLKVVSVRVNNGGSCSTGNHNVSFSGGGGNASGGGTAAASAVIAGGTVTAVNITDDGGELYQRAHRQRGRLQRVCHGAHGCESHNPCRQRLGLYLAAHRPHRRAAWGGESDGGGHRFPECEFVGSQQRRFGLQQDTDRDVHGCGWVGCFGKPLLEV